MKCLEVAYTKVRLKKDYTKSYNCNLEEKSNLLMKLAIHIKEEP